jgi:crossover junction endodeoxyribonuclease RuvC
MIILALDLATTMGWARGAPGQEPVYGSLRLGSKGACHAAILWSFGEWLIGETKLDSKPDVIAYEAPILPHYGSTNDDTLKLLNKLAGVADFVAYGRGYYDRRLQAIPVATWRGYFIGRHRYKTKEAKALTVRKCKLLRWNPQDDNAADALGLWSYVCGQLDPRASLKVTPLFSHRSTAA